MEYSYIIFAEEHSGDHFWYRRGDNHYKRLTGNAHYGDPLIPEEILLEIMDGKKRLFIHNKIRYVVVARGRTYEP